MKHEAILVTGADLPQGALGVLKDYTIVYAGRTPTEASLIELMRAHDPVGILVRYGKITADVIDAGTKLKAISKFGSGIDTIDSTTAKKKGIQVCAAVGVNAVSVAEHALALMLACAKSVTKLNDRMRAGHWDKATHRNIELRGRTLGLVGMGAIGRHVSVLANALGMRVMAYDPYVVDMPDHIGAASLEEIWVKADVISLHCPLTDQTRNLLNAACFDAMKPGVIVINTARGGVIDEEALLAAVQSGKVSYAGLDSFAQEPVRPDHPFFQEERIIMTPHVGAVTHEAYMNVGFAASTNLLTALQDQSIEAS